MMMMTNKVPSCIPMPTALNVAGTSAQTMSQFSLAGAPNDDVQQDHKRVRLSDTTTTITWDQDETSRSSISSIGEHAVRATCPRSPPPIKRSVSMFSHFNLQDQETASGAASAIANLSLFRSPLRDSISLGSTNYHMSFRCSDGRRPLRRSSSVNDIASKKSLDFSDDRKYSHEEGEQQTRSQSASSTSSSFSSCMSTIVEEIPLLQDPDQESSRQRWDREKGPQLKRRRTSGSEDGLCLSRDPSPVRTLSEYASKATTASEVTRKFVALSTMAPPSSTILAHHVEPLISSLLFAPPFETPTRDHLMRSQCDTIDVTQVVDRCLSAVRLVVLDLDETLLNTHTKGRWNASAETLAQHIRPVFLKLFPALLKAGIPVGIATFSPQERLVEDVLAHAFGKDLVRLEQNVFVRGCRDGDNLMCFSSQESQSTVVCNEAAEEEDEDEERMGKRKHIQCILERLERCDEDDDNKTCVSSGQVLFVDDDHNNTDAACKDGHRVVLFKNGWTDDYFLNRLLDALSDKTAVQRRA